jgi:hypothetical protein
MCLTHEKDTVVGTWGTGKCYAELEDEPATWEIRQEMWGRNIVLKKKQDENEQV